MAAGRHVVTANKQVLSQYGEELFDAARAAGVQLRFEGAVAGVVPVIRVMSETLAAAHIERVHGIVNGTTNYILSEMARTGATYDGGAGGGAGAGLRRGRSHRGRERQGRGGEDGDPRPARVQRRGAARPRELRGHREDHPRGHRLRPGPRPLAEARGLGRAARWRASPCTCTPCSCTRATRWPSVNGAVQRGDDRVARDHRDHPLRPRGGRHADRLRGAGRRDLGHDPAAVAAAAGRGPADRDRRGVVVLPPPRGGRPSRACSPRWPRSSASRACRCARWCSGASARTRRLVMVMHPVLESPLPGGRGPDLAGSTSCAPRRA